MGLESSTFISDLVVSNPTGTDPKSQGDDHFNNLKGAIKNTFPDINGAVTASEEELNILDGATLSTAELNVLDGVTSSTAEINILDGVTASTAEINCIYNVTGPIQPQLDAKAPLGSPALTGTPTAPTAPNGTSNTQVATTQFVANTVNALSLPGQLGNNGKLFKTDGVNASWSDRIDTTIVKPNSGTDFATTEGVQTLTNKTITSPIFADAANVTKRANFNLAGITAGQNRNITLANEDMTLFTPGRRLLQAFTLASPNPIWEILPTTIDNTYDIYEFEYHSMSWPGGSELLLMQWKAGGTYITTSTYYSDGTTAGSSLGPSSGTTGVPATYMIVGDLRFYLPWNTSNRKLALSNYYMNGSGSAEPTKKFVNSTILALEGFKFYLNSGANLAAGAIGKWYGLKK